MKLAAGLASGNSNSGGEILAIQDIRERCFWTFRQLSKQIVMVMFVTTMETTLETTVEGVLILDNVNNYLELCCFEWFQNTLKATHSLVALCPYT